MNKQMLVREVHVRKGCFSRRDDADVEPTLVCPLCAVEGKIHGNERTATLANTGHIWCNKGCGRYSAIVMRGTRDGEVSLFPTDLKSAWHLPVQAQALGILRPALAGQSDLLAVVTLDDIQPDAVVGFQLPRLRIDERALGELAFG